MLLSFSCSNYGSIGLKEIELNMAATPDTLHPSSIATYDGHEYIRGAFIYGANGSGKTTVINAIQTLCRIVSAQYDSDSRNGRLLVRSRFRSHYLHRNAPVKFDILFEKNGTKYSYSLSIFNGRIVEETLYYSPNGRMTKLFVRDEETFDFCNEYAKESKNCDGYFQSSRLVLSIAANVTNIKPVQEARDFFIDDIVFLGSGDGAFIFRFDPDEDMYYDPTVNLAKFFIDNPDVKDRVVSLMQGAGMDVMDIEVQKEEYRVSRPRYSSHSSDDSLFEDSDEPRFVTRTRYNMIIHHPNEVSLPYEYESDGTKAYLRMAQRLIGVIDNERVFVCDEPESSMHPNLAIEIIKFFLSSKGKSQMICATHETNLMDLKILRRDQIFFTSIEYADDDRATELYALSDFNGIRNNDANIRTKYLKGYFGAIPKIELNSSSDEEINAEDDDE